MSKVQRNDKSIHQGSLFVLKAQFSDRINENDITNLAKSAHQSFLFCQIYVYKEKEQFFFIAFRYDAKFSDFIKEINKKYRNSIEIIDVPKLSEEEVYNAKKIIVSRLPQDFYSPDNFKELLDTINKNFKYKRNPDYYEINTSELAIGITIKRFLKSLVIDNCGFFVSPPELKSMPMITVKGLPDNFLENDIIQTFKNLFNLTVHKVVKIGNNEKPPKYRVTFDSVQDAVLAAEKFNFAQIDQQYSVNAKLFLPQTPYKNDMKQWKLYILNIPPDVKALQVYSVFRKFGEIYKLKKINNSIYKTSFYSLQYFNKEDALETEKKANKGSLNGYVIDIYHPRTLILKNFENSTNENEIRSYFENLEIININIKKTEGQRPVVFISFKTDKDANEALEIANSILSGGMKIHASSYKLRNEQNTYENDDTRTSENTLYFRNLPETYSQDNLIEVCTRYGVLASANIAKKIINGKTTVSGFVQFQNESNAKSALEQLQNWQIDGGLVQVSPYTPKGATPH